MRHAVLGTRTCHLKERNGWTTRTEREFVNTCSATTRSSQRAELHTKDLLAHSAASCFSRDMRCFSGRVEGCELHLRMIGGERALRFGNFKRHPIALQHSHSPPIADNTTQPSQIDREPHPKSACNGCNGCCLVRDPFDLQRRRVSSGVKPLYDTRAVPDSGPGAQCTSPRTHNHHQTSLQQCLV